jgi:hypothetical protein
MLNSKVSEEKTVRLTLRTLLAYLDDTLEPNQAKLIGQKVAESDTAKELIARIKEVTRQRRLGAPPTMGGKLDANIIAGYLDNTLPAEQLAEVEQLCLASDVHLAELAACHQILTLVLGEPALVPPTAKQRMYGLVRGPEAIPFRKPAAAPREHEEIVHEHRETDETLRLGLPALRAQGGWTNRLILLGGALAVAALLVIAIVQILQFDREPTERAQAAATQQAKADTEAKPKPITAATAVAVTKPATVATAPAKTTTAAVPEKNDKNQGNSPEKGNASEAPAVPAVEEVAWTPPNDARSVAGHYERNASGDPSILVQYDPEKRQWQRVDAKKSEVFTGRPLVSLPGYKSVVALKNGVRLTLWGNVPELWPSPPVFESMVQLHNGAPFDADLTLRRGRIVLASTRSDRPARVRVRLENPSNPAQKETWDIALEDRDTEVAVERFGRLTPGEPFYKNAADKGRKGPIADVALLVLRGRIRLKNEEITVPLEAPPKRALILWNSVSGMGNPSKFPDLPDWAKTPLPPLPMPGDKQQLAQRRADFYRARDNLNSALTGKVERVDVGLANALKSADPSERMLVVRCLGAMDELDSLMDALGDEAHPEVRLTGIEEMKQWITYSRDNDLRLYDVLKARYKTAEADNIMQLLHGFSPQELAKKEPYETLIDYLTNPNPAIRELSATYLYTLVPEGRSINYNAYADSRDRERAQQEWSRLLEKLVEGGKIPRRPMSK